MSRSLLHDWEHDIVKYSINVGEMMKVAKDIYDTAYARGKSKEKTGHWIVDWSATSRLNRDRSLTYEYHVHCDSCGYRWDYTTDKKGSLVSNYCPNCGAKMIEPQESEDKHETDRKG